MQKVCCDTQKVFEKIIEKLEEIKEKCLSRDDLIGCTDFKKAVEIVKQEAEKYNNGWIPCSEQLPKESDKYNDELYPMCLVTIESGETCLGVFRYDVNKWYTKMFCGENNYSTERNVIAWQPLPAPYKET